MFHIRLSFSKWPNAKTLPDEMVNMFTMTSSFIYHNISVGNNINEELSTCERSLILTDVLWLSFLHVPIDTLLFHFQSLLTFGSRNLAILFTRKLRVTMLINISQRNWGGGAENNRRQIM
jgi:hypothetical protein